MALLALRLEDRRDVFRKGHRIVRCPGRPPATRSPAPRTGPTPPPTARSDTCMTPPQRMPAPGDARMSAQYARDPFRDNCRKTGRQSRWLGRIRLSGGPMNIRRLGAVVLALRWLRGLGWTARAGGASAARRSGPEARRRPIGGRDDLRHRRREPAAGRARRRADPRARRQRHRRRHRRQRHDRPDGADRQRHRRRPLHHLSTRRRPARSTA